MADIYTGNLTMSDNWGSVITEEFPKGVPASGESIQNFIKENLQSHAQGINSKPSVFYSVDDNANNQNVMLAFRSQEDLATWQSIYEAEGANPLEGLDHETVLTSTRMNKAEPKPYYSVILENHTPTGNTYVSTDNRVVISLKFVSTYYAKVGNSLVPQIIIEDGDIYFERRKKGDAWAPLTQNVPITSIASAGENDGPIDIDLTAALSEGYQEVRVMVVGATSKESTPWMQFNITKTQLKLELSTDWNVPQSNGVINLSYKISGEVDKNLNVRILGEEEDRVITTHIGEGVYTTTSYQLEPIRDAASDKVKVITHGVKTIESWLSLVGNDKVTSDHIVSQVMVVTDPSDDTPHIILDGFTLTSDENGASSLTSTLTNWTNQTLFNYALYHPTKDKIPFSMELRGFNATDSYLSENYAEINTKQKIEYRNIIEIEENDSMIYAELKFYSGDTLLTDPISVAIDNTGGYSPTADADIIINPRTRSNEESDVATIINTVDKSVIPSTWTGFDFTRDGWITDSNGNRCLRVLSGQELTIDYPLFTGWQDKDATNNSCTIEFSFATRNISDETTPIIRMCRYNEGSDTYDGWEQRATEAVYMTPNKYDRIKQDVWFTEGVMTHVAINIVHNLINGQNFCRIFVNGRINREFTYNESSLGDTGQNALAANARKIIFGNIKNGCDVDIYGFRVYKKRLESSDILQDYISNLPTIEEKQAEKIANSITNAKGEIDYDLASKYYNTLLWKFNEASGATRMVGLAESVKLGDDGKPTGGDNKDVKVKGDLVIKVFQMDDNGNQVIDPNTGMPILDKERSGTINNMTAKGQGTSSMYYWKWNQRWEFKEYDKGNYDKGYRNSVFTPLSLSDNYTLVEDYSWETEDGESVLVNNSKWHSKEKNDLNQPIEILDDTRKAAWQPQPGAPFAARLDGKINFASPMQSHKLGSVNLYTDLWKDIVKDNEITATGATSNGVKFTGTSDGYKSCRVSVVQRPFLVFCQKDANSPIEFYGLYTMGPSKGDKPTFGYNKKDFPNFVMMEGCDNGAKLVRCLVPWNDIDIKPEEVDDDGEKVFEIFYIGKDEQWEISMGSTGVKKVCSVTEVTDEQGNTYNEYGPVGSGSNPVFKHFRDMCNFCYVLNPRLKCWDKGDGDYASLSKAQAGELFDGQGNKILPDTGYVYWTIKGAAIPASKELVEGTHYIYNTYRYDGDKSKWVHCGIEYDSTGNDYVPLNISVQTGYTPTTGTREVQNQNFIDKRVQAFKGGIKEYVDERDMRYSLSFLKLIAASDNWAKNTYIYNAGVTNAEGKLTSKWRFFQDDLDTILSLDNSGYKVKPYYVEEHDSYVNDKGETVGYWNASDNAMYCLAEMAWVTEYRQMMREILGAMTNRGGSPAACFDKYYGGVTKYIPAIAYNEITRKLYEDAEVNRAAGLYPYGNTVDPLAQAVGDQLQAETQWLNQRSTYLASYATYGIFASGTESQDGSLAFRAGGSEGSSTELRFTFTPSMWLYPSMANGSSTVNGVVHNIGETPNWNFNPSTIAAPPRVKPGQQILFKTTASADQTVTIRGVDYYTDMGDFGRVTASSKYGFPLSGRKLEQFKITDDNGKIILLPSSLSTPKTGMDNIKRIEIRGQIENNVSIIGGELDLSGLWRLNYVDVTASSITALKLPDQSGITTLKLPATLRELKLEAQPKLKDMSLAGVRNVKNLTISKCPELNSYDLFGRIYTAGIVLDTCYIDGINWKDVTISQLNYLTNIYDCTLKGVITLKDREVLDFNTKASLLAKFGNIDDDTNDLRVIYETREFDTTSARIMGDSYITVNGEYDYKVFVNDGNNFKSIEWSLSDRTYAEIDSATGVLTYRDVESDIERETIITCTIEIPNKSGVYYKFKISKTIYFNERIAEIGDYVYSDGSISAPSDYNSDKTVVGICFYANPNDPSDRLMVATQNLNVGVWGLSTNSVKGLSVYDVQALNNLSSTGAVSGNYINVTDIWDEANNTYKEHPTTNGLGEMYITALSTNMTTEDGLYKPDTARNAGSLVHKGLKNNLEIIEHRNENVLKSPTISFTGKSIPGKDVDAEGNYYYINDEMSDLVTIMGSAESPAYFYPASSQCWAYEPTVGNLKSEFKKHNWWLPSLAELAHIWYCWKKGKFTKPTQDGVFTNITNSTAFWSSSEYTAEKAWFISFDSSSSGWVYNDDKGTVSKSIRPVTKF